MARHLRSPVVIDLHDDDPHGPVLTLGHVLRFAARAGAATVAAALLALALVVLAVAAGAYALHGHRRAS